MIKIQKESKVKQVKTIIFCLFILMDIGAVPICAQSFVGDEAVVEPMMLVDRPTAGLLNYGSYSVYGNFFQRGGMLFGICVGIFEPFTFGISYGGTDIIGHDAIHMNPLPGVSAKLRVVGEGMIMPAIAIGFDSQGKEPYLDADSLKRYTIKSTGLYVVASKNYSVLGNLSIHGGLNKSLEESDGDKDLNMFVGAEKSLGRDISIMLEYDFAINDNNNNALGKGNGYLNFGFRWSWGKGLVIGFNLKNITKNQNNINIGNRTIQIDYTGAF
jgi:hypothetical protein